MQIKYRTANPMNFQTVRYFVIFNTSGTAREPYANAFQNGYANYSFAFAVGGTGGTLGQPQLFQYIQNPSTGQVTVFSIPYTTQQVQLISNSDGNNREFTLLFARTVFFNVFTPTPGPTSSSGPSPSPLPSGPRPVQTSAGMNVWAINFITTDTNNVPLDALGPNGKIDNSYLLQLNVNTAFDEVQRLTVPAGAPQAGDPAAQLAGGEIVNNP